MKNKNQEPEQEIKDQETCETEAPKAEAKAETAEAKPQSDLEKLQEEHAKLNDRYLRTLAEYDNFRRRSRQEKDNIYPEAKASVLTELLPVMDNFERAMGTPCEDPNFKKGMELIFKSFQDLLKKQGVEEFGAPGDVFDAACHNAVMHIDDENFDENVVCEVFQKGYRMGDKVLRYAMVKVAN